MEEECALHFFYLKVKKDYSSSKTSFPNPQIGQTQSSGMSSNAVPGATPLSGSPTTGSYS